MHTVRPYGARRRPGPDRDPGSRARAPSEQSPRRGEGFFFAWREDVSVGGGRRSIWVHRDSDLEFRYQDARALARSSPPHRE
ncbi:DUF7882 family protein [Microbacterium radiodurans]